MRKTSKDFIESIGSGGRTTSESSAFNPRLASFGNEKLPLEYDPKVEAKFGIALFDCPFVIFFQLLISNYLTESKFIFLAMAILRNLTRALNKLNVLVPHKTIFDAILNGVLW